LWNLAGGTYSIVASPQNASSTLSFGAQLIPESVEPALTLNSPVNVNVAAGNVARYTFQANAGDSVALQLAGASGAAMQMNVYRPDVGQITASNAYASLNVSTASAQVLTLSKLPASGTYVVLLWGGAPSSSAQLTLIPPLNLSVLSTTGSISNFVAANAAQSVNMTFAATAGANLELTLGNVSASGASTNGFEVLVRDPSGYQVANFYCYAADPGTSCTQPLWNLVAGTYSVTAVPVWGGTLSFSVQLQPDLIGPTLSSGTAVTANLAAGQAERITFSANEGSNIVLQLAGVSTTPANQAVHVDLFRPDTGPITPNNAYASFAASGANNLSLSSLPATGTYTAVLHTATGIPASAQMSYTRQ
jgi:hypothetical protein